MQSKDLPKEESALFVTLRHRITGTVEFESDVIDERGTAGNKDGEPVILGAVG